MADFAFSPGYYLIRFEGMAFTQGRSRPPEGTDEPRQFEGNKESIGEIEFKVMDDDTSQSVAQLIRIGLINRGFYRGSEFKEYGSGRISISTTAPDQETSGYVGNGKLSMQFNAEMMYEELLEDRAILSGGSFRTQAMRVALEANYEVVESERIVAIISFGTLSVNLLEANEETLIDTIDFSFQGTKSVITRLAPLGSEIDGKPPTKKTINITPIIFPSTDIDQSNIELLIDDQLNAAQKLWNPGCVHFKRLESKWMSDTIGFSTNLADADVFLQLTKAYNEQFQAQVPLKTIIVFFVPHCLNNFNGGNTIGGGANSRTFISTFQASKNRFLLAHELGHMLKLWHPGEQRYPYIDATSGSVLKPSQPSGEPLTDNNCQDLLENPDKNSLQNCMNAVNSNQDTDPYDCAPDADWTI